MIKSLICGVVCFTSLSAFGGQDTLNPMQVFQQKKISLGKLIFNDTSLSEPAGLACGSCHISDKAFSDPGKVVSAGANGKLFGPRNTPSISYVRFNPVLHWDFQEKHWVGGFFLDGRETNIQSQARVPFTNSVEMGNKTDQQVIDKIKKAPYADMLKSLYGKDIFTDADNAMYAVTDALVNYEMGPEFAKFSSKFDWFLQGKVQLSKLEKLGLEVFEDPEKGNCSACHISKTESPDKPPVFSDYTYDNLGLAKPQSIPFYKMDKKHNPLGKQFVDNGLGDNPNIHNNPEQLGKFKVPTLRNVAITGPYMHNGMFDDLKEVVKFYNARDIDKKWGKPEIDTNVNREELGDLKLTEHEVDALVAFMKTLTDGYQPAM